MADNEIRSDTKKPERLALDGSERRGRRLLAVVCILVLCAAGSWAALEAWRSSLKPGRAATSANGQRVRRQSPQPARTRQELLREFYASLDGLAASIAPADIDVAARARQLGGPEAIFVWVAEEIRYEHYDGVLRGALGTMIAGAGNSCDKALLLSELLGAAGYKVRVRRGAADAGLNDRLVELALRSAANVTAEMVEGPEVYLLSRASREVRSIAGATPGFAEALKQTVQIPAVSSFCWVEDERSGSSRVLDPTLQDQTAPAPADASDSPAQQRFEVRFTVVLETSDGGVVKEEVVHTSSFPADVLGYQPIMLRITPAGDLLARLQKSSDPWAELARIDAFYPVISFGDRQEITKGFSLDGKLVELNATPLQGVESSGNRIRDMLGGAASRAAPDRTASIPAARVSSAFDGVRLDIDLSGPGAQTRISRPLVRGAALRAEKRAGAAALHVVQERQFLVPTFAISRPYGAHLIVEHFRKNRPVLEELASGSVGSELKNVNQYPFRLLTLAARQDRSATLIGRWHNGALFRARPAVLGERTSFDVEGHAVARRTTIDIGDTGFTALSRSGSSRLLRALQGVHSTLLEADLLPPPASIGTIAVLERAAAKKIDIVAIASEDDPALARVSIPEQERAALLHDLRAGYSVVTVARLVRDAFPRYAWWRVDRNSGEVLGILPTLEGGQSATETFLKQAAAGALVGGAFTYLNCYFLQDQGGYRCLFAAGCGAIVGGLSAGVGGLFGDASFRLILAGGAVGGALGFPGEFCEVPPHNPTDNDGDGIPNDEDDNDDNPRNDDSDLPDEPRWPGGPSDHDDDNDDYPDDEDDFPSDSSEHSDHDGDGIGDNSDTDADDDGVPNCNGSSRPCDAYPTDEAAYSDIDGDGDDDRGDPFVDADGDGIDDQQDACMFCMLPPQNDFDRDGDPNIHDPDPRDPQIHRPGKWNREARYPNGPRLPKRAGS